MPKYCAALSKAACAVDGDDESPARVTPRRVARPVAVGAHGQQDAFGAAGGDRAARSGRWRVAGAKHVRRHRHDFRFILDRAGPQVKVEWVALRVQRIDAVQEVDVIGVAVVDRAGDKAVAPACALARLQRLHFGQHLWPRSPCIRQGV